MNLAKALWLIEDADVLDAFKKVGYPDSKPRKEWHYDNGTYMYIYDFDSSEWDSMFTKLYVNAVGVSPSSPLINRCLSKDNFAYVCKYKGDKE